MTHHYAECRCGHTLFAHEWNLDPTDPDRYPCDVCPCVDYRPELAITQEGMTDDR